MQASFRLLNLLLCFVYFYYLYYKEIHVEYFDQRLGAGHSNGSLKSAIIEFFTHFLQVLDAKMTKIRCK